MIRGENDDGIIGYAQLFEQIHHAPELFVERVDHRIIAAQHLAIPVGVDKRSPPLLLAVEELLRITVHIGIGRPLEILRQVEMHVPEAFVTARIDIAADPRVVGRIPGEHHGEGLSGRGFLTDVVQGQRGKHLGAVPAFQLDEPMDAAVVLGMVKGIVTLMVERIGRPVVVESHAFGPRLAVAAVQIGPMMLAHVTQFVAGIAEHVRPRTMVGIEVDLVDDHARRTLVFARDKTGPVGGAHGSGRDRLGEGKPVDVGRNGLGIAGVAQGVPTQLVGDDIDDVGFLRRFRYPGLRRGRCAGKQQSGTYGFRNDMHDSQCWVRCREDNK